MKQSMRAKRMDRNHRRNAQQTKLSLVSLMDIFTILVFFLMLNASDVQVLDNHKSVTLPQATSELAAKETLLILVNGTDILIEGQRVTDVETVMRDADSTISLLAVQLELHKAALAENTVNDGPDGHPITIMGDRSVPYALLKKIMTTCASAGFTNVSLAIEQIIGADVEGEVAA